MFSMAKRDCDFVIGSHWSINIDNGIISPLLIIREKGEGLRNIQSTGR